MTDLIKFLRTSTSSAFNKVAADRIEELLNERDDLRNFDDYFRSVCGFKRDGRDSSKCLDDFLAGINRQDIFIPFDHFLQVQKERDDLGRKLNMAVEALRKIADHKHFVAHQGWTQNAEARIASAALAELEVKE